MDTPYHQPQTRYFRAIALADPAPNNEVQANGEGNIMPLLHAYSCHDHRVSGTAGTVSVKPPSDRQPVVLGLESEYLFPFVIYALLFLYALKRTIKHKRTSNGTTDSKQAKRKI